MTIATPAAITYTQEISEMNRRDKLAAERLRIIEEGYRLYKEDARPRENTKPAPKPMKLATSFGGRRIVFAAIVYGLYYLLPDAHWAAILLPAIVVYVLLIKIGLL